MVGPAWRVMFEEPSRRTMEIFPAGVEGVHLIVKTLPALMVEPGVDGAEKASKPAVCATTLDTAVSAKRQELRKEYCMVNEIHEEM